MLSREELARQVADIELITLRKLNTIFAGSRASERVGSGLEFEEFRDYVPGQDNVSRIDWLASKKVPHRTLYQDMVEEKELNIILFTDVSASMRYAKKMELLLKLAATIGSSALKLDDRIGLISFSDTVEQIVEPGTGRQHWSVIIEHLFDRAFTPKRSATHFLPPLDRFENLSLGTSMIFFLSDFPLELLDEEFSSYCKRLQVDHDFIPVYLYDDIEFDLGTNRRAVFRFEDLESGDATLFYNTKKNQEALQNSVAKGIKKRERFFQKIGINGISVNDNNYLDELIKVFTTRRTPR